MPAPTLESLLLQALDDDRTLRRQIGRLRPAATGWHLPPASAGTDALEVAAADDGGTSGVRGENHLRPRWQTLPSCSLCHQLGGSIHRSVLPARERLNVQPMSPDVA